MDTISQITKHFNITKKDIQKTIEAFMKDGYIKSLPAREKKKVILIIEIAKKFESDREYAEKVVNQIISSVTDDYATVRRYLVDYGLFYRTKDGSSYHKLIQ